MNINFMHYNFPENPVYTNSDNSFILHNIAAQVANMTDEAIIDAIVRSASEQGLTDLYVIDSTFVKDLLTKSIAKSPNLCNGQFSCPNCEKLFGDACDISYGDKQDVKSNNYCSECGQHLDWGTFNS